LASAFIVDCKKVWVRFIIFKKNVIYNYN
jgi:hypothetical protein